MTDADLFDRIAERLFAAQLVPSTPHVWVHLAESERGRWRNLAKVAVDTLTEAGRLLPEGGQTHTEDEERPDIGPATRAVTVWPDGTELARPWQPYTLRRPVDTEGENRG